MSSSNSDSDVASNFSDDLDDFNLMQESDEDDVAAYSVSGEIISSFSMEGGLIRVVKANISKEKVDVILNSTSTNLNLKSGRASRELLREAGDSIQTECTQKYPNGITAGEVAVTGPGNLQCQYVYHGSLEKWGKPNAEKIHTGFITKCLEKAHQDNLQSIAIPGLTTGFLSFPKDVAARNACKCIEEFLQKNQGTTLKDIRFVIHSGDRPTLKAFSRAVSKWKDTVNQAVPACTLGSLCVGSVSVSLMVDRLEEQQVDVIVNSTNTKLDLQKGRLSRTLSKAAGPSLQQQCKDNYPGGIQDGDLAVTGGGDLKCKHVYHGCLPDYNQQSQTSSAQILTDLVSNCLKEMGNNTLISIALPALGTEFRKFPARVSAKAIIAGIGEFWNNDPQTSVTDVRIIILGSDRNIIGKVFERELGLTSGARRSSLATAVELPVRGSKEFCVRKYAEEIRPPSYWNHFSARKTVKQWKLEITEKGGELVQTFDVDQKTEQDIINLVQNTWKADKVGHGRDAAGLGNLGFTKIKVTKVQRIENIDLYEKYANTRAQLFHKAGNIGIFEPLENITGSQGPIETSKHAGETLQQDMFNEVNEYYLFHGTKTNTRSAIERQGLDFRMAGEKAMFGQGMYLAESSTKADQYTDNKNQRTKEDKHIFLSRVCLGKICLLATAKNTLKRPPCFTSGCGSDSCSHGDYERCDSVIGDGQWIFREFVIYSQYQAYPEYIITYQRE